MEMKKNTNKKGIRIIDAGMRVSKHIVQIGIITGILVLLSVSIGVVSAATITVQPGGSIQDAIDTLPTEGGIVELAPGVHDVYEPIIINRNDVTIQGTHDSEIMAHDPSRDIFCIPYECVDFSTCGDDDWENKPTLENFVFKGFKVNSIYLSPDGRPCLIEAWQVRNITVEDIYDTSHIYYFVAINPTGGGSTARSYDIYIR
jgi:hypothetical protein